VTRALALAIALLAGAGAQGMERLGVLAVADPPKGPDPDLTELAHQLRAACRDRVGGVEEVSSMRARLLGQGSNATPSELDRAYGGALAVYQNGEFESSVRTLRAILDDLEALPETEESYFQWKRALLRLAYAELTVGDQREFEAALARLARTEPTLQPDPEQYSPTFRRRFEEVKAKVRALPRRKLAVVAEGTEGTVYVNGRPMGKTPLTLTLPAGAYRIGGAAGALRVPSVAVDLQAEDRSVVLDFALAESLRVNSGPGLALPAERRAYGIVRAGAWLGVDKLVVVSRVEEGQAQFLLGSMYDVRRGALLREGSVRMTAGGVPSVSLGALASFLLTGQSSRDVKDRTQEPREILVPPLASAAPPAVLPAAAAAGVSPVAPLTAAPAPSVPSPPAAPVAIAASAPLPAAASRPALAAAPPPPAAPSLSAIAPEGPPGAAVPRPPEPTANPTPGWMRPTAIGAGALALGMGLLAVQQGLSASRASSQASGMVGSDGVLLPGSDPARYQALLGDADAARRNAYISAGVAVVCATTAGVLGWKSWDRPPEPAVTVHF